MKDLRPTDRPELQRCLHMHMQQESNLMVRTCPTQHRAMHLNGQSHLLNTNPFQPKSEISNNKDKSDRETGSMDHSSYGAWPPLTPLVEKVVDSYGRPLSTIQVNATGRPLCTDGG